jgi:hypothetical protein
MKQRTDPSTKPYYKCLSCHQFRKECGGLPTRGMPLQEWCEYMRDVKEIALPRLTNAYIAEKAAVSLKTIEKIMAINCEQDIMRGTSRQVELAIIGPVTNYLCCMDFKDSAAAERIERLLAEIDDLRKDLARKNKIIDKYLD